MATSGWCQSSSMKVQLLLEQARVHMEQALASAACGRSYNGCA